MRLEFFATYFRTNLNIKFNQNLSSVNRVVPCGWTDGHVEANSRFPQFFLTRLEKSGERVGSLWTWIDKNLFPWYDVEEFTPEIFPSIFDTLCLSFIVR